MTTSRIFGSQDPHDLLRDPLPYVDRATGERQWRPGYLTTYYSPRPEYVLHLPHPTNRALVDMRDERNRQVYSGRVDAEVFYAGAVTAIDENPDYDTAEKEHAKRIATLLAAIS
ncbi:MAG: hypothetical protein J0J04_04725 [Microbacterium sp.]|uniref:hypothetical protein n=1 Tax=Microbacterium sp. TaxID=51671 RepID=UPI001ACDD4B2|nr:hypothetical protein [Microbacterium sp.]MBN9214112.1 hypothetical protein [Microbacterium sp.]